MSIKNKYLKNLKKFFIELGIACRFLIILMMICFPVICLSIFNVNLEADENLVALRTIFSSITGYILEKSTCNPSSNNILIKNKLIIVGTFAIISTCVVILSYFFNSNINNPSLVLIKNLLFSSVGFLISASENKSE